ncbi:MAG: Ig-like domain-containing protein, partial [Verrucomicrobiota bacterium]
TSPNATGSLSYTPVANASGTATITVIVTDDGGTANGGVVAVTNTFTVTVTSVNDAPTLAAISNPAAILEDASLQTVNLSGISAGGGESQVLTVTASSSNPGLIPNPSVTYTSPNATGSLSYTPVANASGQRQRHGHDHGECDRQRRHVQRRSGSGDEYLYCDGDECERCADSGGGQ